MVHFFLPLNLTDTRGENCKTKLVYFRLEKIQDTMNRENDDAEGEFENQFHHYSLSFLFIPNITIYMFNVSDNTCY